MNLYNFGCILSPYDSRDYKVRAANASLPEEFELDFSNVQIKSQGSVGSCVAHAMSTILEYHAHTTQKLSTNFIYGIRKKLYGSQGQGMQLRHACKIVTDYGDPFEKDCPGNTEVPNVFEIAESVIDNEEIMGRAATFRTKSYYSCKTNDDIKHALVNYGPVIISIKWYNDYKVKNGILVGGLTQDYGYHALVCYGYNKDGFLIQNSWGKNWGEKGRFILPYDIKICEARGLIDLENGEYTPPKEMGTFKDALYKGFNLIVNFVKYLVKKFEKS